MTDALAQQLRTHLGTVLRPGVDVRDLRRITGGASHETWSVDAIDGGVVEPLVVRRDIENGLLDSDGDAEYRLLRALHRAGIPVPRPWLHVPGGRDGRSITVLQRVAGADARKLLASRGPAVDAGEVRRRAGGLQAAIHRVAWRTHLDGVLAAARPGHGSVARAEVDRWAAVVGDGATDVEPLLEAAVSWLRAHPPRDVEPVLVHGDFKANNLLVSPSGDLTVLDWELAHLGDPVEDLAWTLLWDTDADLVGGAVGRDEYLGAYLDAGGTHLDEQALFFWELFSLVKLAAIFLTGVRPGATNLPSLLMLGRAVPHLEHRVAGMLVRALDRGAA